MNASPYILETEGLTKGFRGFTAVDHVDLRVKRHEIHALIGPNGAGKTTVFNLLTKFLTPTEGVIRFNGKDITSAKPAEIARMGVIRSFQISAVFPHMTARENVRVALQRKLGLKDAPSVPVEAEYRSYFPVVDGLKPTITLKPSSALSG